MFRSRAKLAASTARVREDGLSLAMLPGVEETCATLSDHLEMASAGNSKADPVFGPHFAAHGTVMAGLISARPPPSDAVKTVGMATLIPHGRCLFQPCRRSVLHMLVPTYFCRLVSTAPHFDVDPRESILILRYAGAVRADIIVLAHGFCDPRMIFSEMANAQSAQHREQGRWSSDRDDGRRFVAQWPPANDLRSQFRLRM